MLIAGNSAIVAKNAQPAAASAMRSVMLAWKAAIETARACPHDQVRRQPRRRMLRSASSEFGVAASKATASSVAGTVSAHVGRRAGFLTSSGNFLLRGGVGGP